MTKNESIWICKFNQAIDCGSATQFCEKCGWNPSNVSLRCYRIIKALGVNHVKDNYSSNSDCVNVGQNLQGRRETR